MRLWSMMLVVAMGLGLSGCYEVGEPLVAADQSRHVAGVEDGVWRRADGNEVSLTWMDGAYRVASGGVVRLAALDRDMFLVDYQAEHHVAMLARLDHGQISILVPRSEVEDALLAAHGLQTRPGPIRVLRGDSRKILDYFRTLSGLDGVTAFQEVDRLRWVRPIL